MKLNVALFLIILVAIGFASQAEAQTSFWKKMTPSENIGTAINVVLQLRSPTTGFGGRLFAGTSNGLYWKIDASYAWTRNKGIPLNRQVTCMAQLIDTARRNYGARVYLGTDSGIYKSMDSGSTWQGPFTFETGQTGPGVDHVYAIQQTMSGNVFFGTDYGVYEETISGFSRCNMLPTRSLATMGNYILAVDDDIYSPDQYARLSTDDGASWLNTYTLVSQLNYGVEAGKGGGGAFLGITTSASSIGGAGAYLISSKDGFNWDTVWGPWFNFGLYLSVSPYGQVFLLADYGIQPYNNLTSLYVSLDGSPDFPLDWSDVYDDTSSTYMTKIFADWDNSVYIPISDGSLAVSTPTNNASFSLSDQSLGLSNACITSIFASNFEVVASKCSLPYQSPWLYVNEYGDYDWQGILGHSGQGWVNYYPTVVGSHVFGFLEFGDTTLLATDIGVCKIVNGYSTHTLGYPFPYANAQLISVWCLTLDGHDVYAASDSGLFHSTDAGDTWTNINSRVFLFVKKLKNGVIYATDGSSFFTSNDWVTWTSLNVGLVYPATSFEVDETGNLYVASNITKAANITQAALERYNGQTWTNLLRNPGIPDLPVSQISIAPNNDLIVCDSLGVFESSDHGDTWFDQSGGLFGLPALCIGFAPNGYGYVGTDGYGCFKSAHAFVAAPVPAKIQLTAPVNGYATTNDSIFFSWVADPAASTYTLEVATDAGFTNLIVAPTWITQPMWEVVGFTPGKYYWRVLATNAEGDGPYSDTWELTIKAPPLSVTSSIVDVVGNLFPNPTTGTFTAQLPADFGKPERLLLLDVLGKTVRDVTSEVTLEGLNINCKLPPLPDGAYFFRVESKTQALVYKVLVKK